MQSLLYAHAWEAQPSSAGIWSASAGQRDAPPPAIRDQDQMFDLAFIGHDVPETIEVTARAVLSGGRGEGITEGYLRNPPSKTTTCSLHVNQGCGSHNRLTTTYRPSQLVSNDAPSGWIGASSLYSPYPSRRSASKPISTGHLHESLHAHPLVGKNVRCSHGSTVS